MKKFKSLWIVIAAATAMVAGFWFSLSISNINQIENPVIQGVILPDARKISVPELLKDDGSRFINSDLEGHWTLLFFGYTHCPDICPTTLNMLVQARKNFNDNSSNADFPEVMLVSVDPQRDSVEVLNQYVKYFEPTFTGITGKPEMIKALTLQLSVVYMQVPNSDGSESQENYAVDHSSSILLINPQGKLHAFLNPPHSVTSIVDSLRTIIN